MLTDAQYIHGLTITLRRGTTSQPPFSGEEGGEGRYLGRLGEEKGEVRTLEVQYKANPTSPLPNDVVPLSIRCLIVDHHVQHGLVGRIGNHLTWAGHAPIRSGDLNPLAQAPDGPLVDGIVRVCSQVLERPRYAGPNPDIYWSLQTLLLLPEQEEGIPTLTIGSVIRVNNPLDSLSAQATPYDALYSVPLADGMEGVGVALQEQDVEHAPKQMDPSMEHLLFALRLKEDYDRNLFTVAVRGAKW